MKRFLVMTLLVLSSLAFAEEGRYCITNGDCQLDTQPERGYKCAVVKSGRDMMGDPTCALRCHHVMLGFNCIVPKGELYGRCVKEKFKVPQFDPQDPNRCDSAVEIKF